MTTMTSILCAHLTCYKTHWTLPAGIHQEPSMVRELTLSGHFPAENGWTSGRLWFGASDQPYDLHWLLERTRLSSSTVRVGERANS